MFCPKTYSSIKISKFLFGLVLCFIAFLYLDGLKEKIKVKIPGYFGKLYQTIKLMLSIKQSTSSLLHWNWRRKDVFKCVVIIAIIAVTDIKIFKI